MEVKKNSPQILLEVSNSDSSNYNSLKIKGVGQFKIQSQRVLKELKLIYESTKYDEPLSYKLYEFRFGTGQLPEFLITPPNEYLQNGEQRVYLCPMIIGENDEIYYDMPSPGVVKKIAKRFGIDLVDDDKKIKSTEDIWNEILISKPKFYRIASPLSKDSLDKLKQSNNQKLNKIIDYYLTEGNEIDKRLILAIKSHFLDYDLESAKPKHIMPYNPHAVIVTNTKTTKSSLYEKIGEKRERMSMAGALGFSTGNETNYGDLNNVMGSYAIDEVQEEKKTNVVQQTLTAAETGTVAISVGKQTVRTSTCGILTFLTNPKELTEPVDYFNPRKTAIGAFRRVCEILTDNYRAFGSRIAIHLFGTDFVSVRGQRLDYKTSEGVKAIVDSIKKEVAPEFTKIMLNQEVHEWMNSDLPSEYIEKIKSTCKSIPIREVREIWEGHSEAFRHIRGGAVRRSCMDFLLDIWKGDYNVPEILKNAEIYLRQILDFNLESLGEIAEVSEDYLDGFLDNLLKNVQPEYIRHFVLLLRKYLDLNENAEQNYILFNELRNVFDSIENKDLLFGGKYSRWNELKNKFENVRPTIQTKLLNDFGIQATKIEGVTAFQVIDIPKFNQFRDTELFKQVSLENSGVSGENGVNGVNQVVKNTPSTPKTPITPEKYSSNKKNIKYDKIKSISVAPERFLEDSSK